MLMSDRDEHRGSSREPARDSRRAKVLAAIEIEVESLIEGAEVLVRRSR